MDSELENRVKELLQKMEDVGTAATALNTTATTLNTTWNSTITALNNLSSKLSTPRNLDNMVTSGASSKMSFRKVKQFELSGGNTAFYTNCVSSTTDGTYLYISEEDYESIFRWKLSDGTIDATFDAISSARNYTIETMYITYHPDNDYILIAGHDVGRGMVSAIDTSGNGVFKLGGKQDQGVYGTDFGWSTTSAWAWATFYDEDNDNWYVIWGSTGLWSTAEYVLAVHSTTDGSIESYQTFVSPFGSIYTGETYKNFFILSHGFIGGLGAMYVSSTGATFAEIGLPAIPYVICRDRTNDLWYSSAQDLSGNNYAFSSTNTVIASIVVYSKRKAIEEHKLSSLFVYSNVSVGTSATRIFAEDSSREGFAIFNNDSTNKTLYVGSNSSVTTSNGRPVLPQTGFQMFGYSGDVWVISDTAATDVRYRELK